MMPHALHFITSSGGIRTSGGLKRLQFQRPQPDERLHDDVRRSGSDRMLLQHGQLQHAGHHHQHHDPHPAARGPDRLLLRHRHQRRHPDRIRVSRCQQASQSSRLLKLISSFRWIACEGECMSLTVNSTMNGNPLIASIYTCDPTAVCSALSTWW